MDIVGDDCNVRDDTDINEDESGELEQHEP